MLTSTNRFVARAIERHTTALDYDADQLPLLLVQELSATPENLIYFGDAWPLTLGSVPGGGK